MELNQDIKYLKSQNANKRSKYTFRLDMNDTEAYALIELLQKLTGAKKGSYKKELQYLQDKNILANIKALKKSDKKLDAAKTARDASANKAKEKILNAINLLRLENKNITAYAISKTAGVSYNTVKKYSNLINELKE